MFSLCLLIQKDGFEARSTSQSLRRAGVKAYRVDSLPAAAEILRQWRFDVVLLDDEGFDGKIEAFLDSHDAGSVPVAIATRRASEMEQVRLLERGAMDVVVKPTTSELIAVRMRRLAELGRSAEDGCPDEIKAGPLVLDTRQGRVQVDAVPMALSPSQFGVLSALTLRAGEFVDRHALLVSRGRGTGSSSGRSLDMIVCRLREKLRETGHPGLDIQSVYGRGYRLAIHEEPRVRPRSSSQLRQVDFEEFPA